MTERNNEEHKISILIPIWMGLIANLGTIASGLYCGYSAIALPQLTSPMNSFQLNLSEVSWFAGLGSISTALGSLLSGPIVDRFGCKKTLLLSNIPCFIGWILIATVQDSRPAITAQLYIGRLLTGLSMGLSTGPAAIYSGAIATDSLRSSMVTWNSVGVAGGVLIVYILGAIFHDNWRLIAYISAGFPFLTFLCVYLLLQESPKWLVFKNRHEDAKKSLLVLRRHKSKQITNECVETEFNQIVFNEEKSKKFQTEQTFINNFVYLLRPECVKPLIIVTTYFIFQQVSGSFVLIYYAVHISQDAGVTSDPYLVVVFVGLLRFIFSILLSLISKRFGRRPLSITSGTGMTMCMGVLSLFQYLIHIGYISHKLVMQLNWIPVITLSIYISAATIGFINLPFAMLGEVFPTRIRGLASGITIFVAYIVNFIILKQYPFMVLGMEKHGVFFFYGAISLGGTIFIVFFLPETLGKSVQQIENYFKQPKEMKVQSIVTGLVENETLLIDRVSSNSPIIKPMDSNQNLSRGPK